MEKRKSGFYWVKTAMINSGKWIVAYHHDDKWHVPSINPTLGDYHMVEINENRIMSPDEWE